MRNRQPRFLNQRSRRGRYPDPADAARWESAYAAVRALDDEQLFEHSRGAAGFYPSPRHSRNRVARDIPRVDCDKEKMPARGAVSGIAARAAQRTMKLCWRIVELLPRAMKAVMGDEGRVTNGRVSRWTGCPLCASSLDTQSLTSFTASSLDFGTHPHPHSPVVIPALSAPPRRRRLACGAFRPLPVRAPALLALVSPAY